MMNKAKTGPEGPLPGSELITDPARVARLLDRLVKQHSLLTVVIPGQPGQYTSSLVEVETPCVLLDELHPSAGHQLLLARRALEVTGKLDGIDIRFITTLDYVDERDGVITYHAVLPEALEYRQRRLDHRAHIPMSRALRVIIDCGDRTVIEGMLHDLSNGGAGMIFTDDARAVESGLLHDCAIELPDREWLYCAVEIRYSRVIPPRDRQLVGTRFSGLSRTQARLVRHCISELERESIRKRVTD